MEIYEYLPDKIINHIENCDYKDKITEIRLRNDKPVQFTVSGKNVVSDIVILKPELEDIFYKMCRCSVNIYDEDISNGYITLENGHRVGIGGEYFYSKSSDSYVLKEIKSINIRVARHNFYFENQDKLLAENNKSILIVGPPHSGKTSLLKLIINNLSQNFRVVICDERKELYADDVNADVIQGVRKYEAIMMATRTLNPQFIVCDEIGLKKEAEEILSSVNTGVKFICSAHGESRHQVFKRPNIKFLTDNGVFEKIVTVKQHENRFVIEEITDV